MKEQFEALAADWLSRAFDQPSPVVGDACVQLAAICDALAELSVRLEALAHPPGQAAWRGPEKIHPEGAGPSG